MNSLTIVLMGTAMMIGTVLGLGLLVIISNATIGRWLAKRENKRLAELEMNTLLLEDSRLVNNCDGTYTLFGQSVSREDLHRKASDVSKEVLKKLAERQRLVCADL